jgi:AraC-like DNA-binding protein
VLTDDARLRKSDFLHLIPMIIYFAAAFPHIFSSYAYKLEVARRTITEPSFSGTYHFTILTDWFTSAAVYISRPALVFVYALVSGIQIIRFFLAKNTPVFLSNASFIKKWLIIFLCFQLLLIVSHLSYLINSFGVFGQFSSSHNHFFNLISSVFLIGFIVSPIFFPQILYGLPNLLHSSYKPEKVDETEDFIIQKATTKAKSYDQDYMLFIQQKVEDAMTVHKIYLQKEFNLPQLSVLIEIPIHHLAYFFTNFKQQSFNDYRNEFRIRYAKQLIMDAQSETITIEAIGLLSGFSNRNIFSKAFKEIEGVTPSIFAAQQKK